MDLSKDDQFKTDFKKISPFSKIPVIIDHENETSVFESGAILMYLAEKYNKFYEVKDRIIINQWLMAQMGTIGPMLGQHHQFHHYNPGKSEFGEKRFFKITKRLYGELDERLASSEFLAGRRLYNCRYCNMAMACSDMSGMILVLKIIIIYQDGISDIAKREAVIKRISVYE